MSPVEGDAQFIVKNLADLHTTLSNNSSSKHYVKIERSYNGWKLTHTTKSPQNLRQKIFNSIQSIFKKNMGVDDLKGGKELFTEIRDKIGKENGLDKETVINAMETLKLLFENHRSETSAVEMNYKNDILEIISLTQKGGVLNEPLDNKISRIAANTIKPLGKLLKDHEIPLFHNKDLDIVKKRMNEKFPPPTLENIKKKTPLWNFAQAVFSPKEPSSLEEIRSNPQLNARINKEFPPPTLEQIRSDETLNKYLVKEDVSLGRLLEYSYKHHLVGNVFVNRFVNYTLTKIMGWYTDRNLPAGEARTLAVVKFFNKMHISPYTEINGELYSYTEMHGRGIRDELSLNEAFQRPIVPEIEAKLMEKTNEKKKEIQALCGEKATPVICNSFCRMRILKVPKGGATKKFDITGKVLSAEQNVKKERSYGQKFAFSIQDMFGWATKADLSFSEATKPSNPLEAEALYRGVLTNLVNQHDVTMVVQRLAPEDIHHFSMPIDGKVLSIKKACEAIKAKLSKSTNQNEISQLEELLTYYESEENKSGEKATVEIKGTQASVTTSAVKHRSPLSQNDRKIVAIQDASGNLSIQVLIGAVGVNMVNVTTEAEEQTAGASIGSMGFGHDKERKHFGKVAGKTPKPSIKMRLSPTKKTVKAGSDMGEFSKEGSTVIGIFFGDKTFLEPSHTISYEDRKGFGFIAREIEIKTKLGEMIGTPTLFIPLNFINQKTDIKEFISKSLEKSNEKSNEDIIAKLLDVITNQNDLLNHPESSIIPDLQAAISGKQEHPLLNEVKFRLQELIEEARSKGSSSD